jgi:phage tail tape-measure protein
MQRALGQRRQQRGQLALQAFARGGIGHGHHQGIGAQFHTDGAAKDRPKEHRTEVRARPATDLPPRPIG